MGELADCHLDMIDFLVMLRFKDGHNYVSVFLNWVFCGKGALRDTKLN